jgi:signal transduction histidine kinase
MLVLAWLPMVLFTVLHYSTGVEFHWMHDILRRMYYLPIILASFLCGLRGGLVLAMSVAIAYSPHAFTHLVQIDPADTLEKVLELLLYLVVGSVTGLLVDRERRRQQDLHEALEQLRTSLAEQRRMADQLIRAGRLAALGELVAGIAHEIKNPLHALRGTAEVVDQDVPEDSPRRRMWELHLQEIDRLGSVAERFLSFARPTPLQLKPVDLLSVVERAKSLVEAQARKQRVEVLIDEAFREKIPAVVADEQQLAQVLINISLNALQAIADEGGRIEYVAGSELRGDRDYAVITVANTGPAIPEEDLERIFDPFVTSKSDGAGLGLSIASRIVEQHGGFVEVENQTNPKRVAFSVFLPASST